MLDWVSDSVWVKVGCLLHVGRRLHLTHFIFLNRALSYFPGKAFHISQPSSVHLRATSSVQWRERRPLKIPKIAKFQNSQKWSRNFINFTGSWSCVQRPPNEEYLTALTPLGFFKNKSFVTSELSYLSIEDIYRWRKCLRIFDLKTI